jgi:TRAP-type mannitol/chloroaromatic compound transport system permease large subunit
MRRRNWRFVICGGTLILAAGAFFLYMETLMPRSNDPAAMMQTVGQCSGIVAGIALALLIFGLIGRKA